MNMKHCYVLMVILLISFYQFAQLPVLSLGEIPDNLTKRTCIDKVKVADNRPTDNCVAPGDVWYPVIYETFDGNYDIREFLNNYSFKFEDGDYDISDCYNNQVYYSNALSNGNIYVENGNLVLEIKKESGKGYQFSNATLRSLYKTRLGIYMANIKFPNNIYTWPAFWVHYGAASNHDYEEIDWCEFFDNCPAKDNWICNKGGRYSWMRMNIYNKEPDGTDKCMRSTYSDVGTNFFVNYHKFGGVWTEYSIKFQLDGGTIGFATKFSSTELIGGLNICELSRPHYLPKFCIDMMLEPDKWGLFKWNWAYKDTFFPHRPLQTFITCGVNIQCPPQGCPESSYNSMINNYGSFSLDERRTKIDYLTIYQPIKCYTDYTVLNEPQFNSITGGTNFLSGRKITISNGTGNNLYIL